MYVLVHRENVTNAVNSTKAYYGCLSNQLYRLSIEFEMVLIAIHMDTEWHGLQYEAFSNLQWLFDEYNTAMSHV